MNRTILIIVILVIAAGGWYAYKSYRQTTPDLVNKEPDVIITAPELIGAFNEDTAAASKRFVNKIVQVSGKVLSADTSAIVLGNAADASSIVCGIDRRHSEDYKSTRPGTQTVIQGRCVGYEKGEEMLGISLGTTVHLSFAGIKKTDFE